MAATTLEIQQVHDLKSKLFVSETLLEDHYQKWRPRFHVMPAKGWMNDPCAPGYDAVNKLYTLSFQWNPKAAVWGNMSWGSATSPDLVNWTISARPSMQPDVHDTCGVFTGTLMPGTMEVIYTSAQRLPINYQLPYHTGSEKVHLASSLDSGKTWRKTSQALLSAPPAGLDVIGWRDPFVGEWSTMDQIRGEKALYGMLSGGIRSKTPTIFLYRVDSCHLYDWHFLGLLTDLGLRFEPSKWTGNYGINWEVASIITLHDQEDVSRDIILLGSQGIVSDEEVDATPLSANNKSMWMCGDIETDLKLNWKFGGTLDHGCFYAASGFKDPLTNDFVFYGWIFEEDLSPELTEQQNWSGCLSIPRVLSLKLYRNVKAFVSSTADIACFESSKSKGFGFDIRALNIIPDPRLQLSRRVKLPINFATPHAQLEIKISFSIHTGSSSVGFDLHHSKSEKTRIEFYPSSESIIVDRSNSSIVSGTTKTSKIAPHTLFQYQDGTTETLDFHVYFDTSVLEIFVNERTVITTRVYPSSSQCSSVQPWPADGVLRQHEIWDLASGIEWQSHKDY